jgi:hypothetical protein
MALSCPSVQAQGPLSMEQGQGTSLEAQTWLHQLTSLCGCFTSRTVKSKFLSFTNVLVSSILLQLHNIQTSSPYLMIRFGYILQM